MKCIECSKETVNEQEICQKCQKKIESRKKKEELRQCKLELKKAKFDLKKAQFETISDEYEAKYGKGVIPTGLRSGIICISSAVAALLLSHVILPGLIFGFLSIVEGVITIVDVIRNNKRGKKSMIPLAFSISGIIISLVAIIISVLCAISVLIYLLGLGATGIVAILISLII